MEDIRLNGQNFYNVNKLQVPTVSGGTAEFSEGSGGGNPYEQIIDNQITNSKGAYLFAYCKDDNTQFAEHFTSAVANKVANLSGMFRGCANLTSLDLTILPTITGNKSVAYMFEGCSSLNNINFGALTTINLRSAREMFYGCNGFTDLDLTNLNFGNSTQSAEQMFYNCQNLQTITLPSIFVRNDCYNMFRGCRNLTTIDCNDFRISIGSRIQGMFYQCNSLTTVNYNDTKQNWKDNIADYATLFDNNGITQTITVNCTDGVLTYTNVSGTYTYAVTEAPFYILQNGTYIYDDGKEQMYYTFNTSTQEYDYDGKITGTYTRIGNTLQLSTGGALTITSDTTIDNDYIYQS